MNANIPHQIRFAPGQHVVIRVMNQPGRISKVTLFVGPGVSYTVEYWHDGKLEHADLWEDELAPLA